MLLLTSLALADEAIDTTKTGSLTIENRKKFESAQEMEQKKRCLDEMITWADEIVERVETVHNNNTAIERDDSDENIEYVSFLNKKWMQYLKE